MTSCLQKFPSGNESFAEGENDEMSIPNSRERSRLNQWLGTTPYNPSHNISEICNATGKTKVDIYQKNVVQKLPHKLLKDVRLIQNYKKLGNNTKVLGEDSQEPGLSCRNQTLEGVVKIYLKVDIKVFQSCVVLLDLFTFPELSEKTKFWSQLHLLSLQPLIF